MIKSLSPLNNLVKFSAWCPFKMETEGKREYPHLTDAVTGASRPPRIKQYFQT